MAIQEAYSQSTEAKISWDQFQYWYTGFEHSFKNNLGGPSTDQVNEIRYQLSRVRGSDYYDQATSNPISAIQNQAGIGTNFYSKGLNV